MRGLLVNLSLLFVNVIHFAEAGPHGKEELSRRSSSLQKQKSDSQSMKKFNSASDLFSRQKDSPPPSFRKFNKEGEKSNNSLALPQKLESVKRERTSTAMSDRASLKHSLKVKKAVKPSTSSKKDKQRALLDNHKHHLLYALCFVAMCLGLIGVILMRKTRRPITPKQLAKPPSIKNLDGDERAEGLNSGEKATSRNRRTISVHQKNAVNGPAEARRDYRFAWFT